MMAPESAGRKAGSDRLPARRRQAGRSEIEAMERKVEHIPALDRAVLLERFVKLCGFQPPPRFSRKLMELAVAYKLQEQVLGGLKTATRRFLLDAVKAQQKPVRSKSANTRFKAGTVLMREWKGVTHQVTVLDEDFLFGGKRYRSLSEIAGQITGGHWSGPTFFGLTKLPRKADHERQ